MKTGLKLGGSLTYIAATGGEYRPRTINKLEAEHLSGGIAVFGQLGFCLHYIYHTRHTLILACGTASTRSKLLSVIGIPNESIRWGKSTATIQLWSEPRGYLSFEPPHFRDSSIKPGEERTTLQIRSKSDGWLVESRGLASRASWMRFLQPTD